MTVCVRYASRSLDEYIAYMLESNLKVIDNVIEYSLTN